MKKTIHIMMTVAAGFLLAAGVSGCMSTGSSDGETTESSSVETTTHQYLVIPGAQFFSGSPTAAQTGSSATKPRITAPANTTYTVDTIITWTLEWDITVEFEVTDIIIDVPEIDGYFDYMLTQAEIDAGTVSIPTYVTWDVPEKTQVCNRDYRGNGTCYEQADTGVTSMDFTTANIDAYDSNVEIVDLEINFEAEFTFETVVIDEYYDDDYDDDGSYDGDVSGDTACSEWIPMCSCNLRACSDGTNAWYDVGSGVYYCASASVGDCTAAAANAAAWCTRGC
jgi:hypothetical protein